MENPSTRFRHPETALGHELINPADYGGVVNPPVYHASTVTFRDMADMEQREAAMLRGDDVLWYGRKGTPTAFALQNAIAALEGGHRSLVLPSGLAACTSAISAFVKADDHILVSDTVYGPTRHFVKTVLARYGVAATFYDPLVGAGIKALMRPNTRLVVVESPGSQTFEIQDIPAIADVAHRHGALVVMDNTWATPLYFKPFEHGVDVSVQAATKYIVGHSDATLGVITANREHWPVLREYVLTIGQTAGPDDLYLAQRGLRTMALRLERHWKSALEVASWLAARPEVERVLHPALPGDPGHALWKRDFRGASGLFSIVLKPCGDTAARAFVDRLELFALGFSWGGFESLIMPFDGASGREASRWQYTGPAFRLHIGLEAPADLMADLAQGFVALKKAAHADAVSA
ncbi:cystathionine beta-lyase [Pseudoduganella sp. UC29_106]|uniref:cystathionine beta-lyase n=1 Tax=Pseudoduganella sp. UC29_106 TaxID=3374553 RepID=UPI0037578FA0